MPFLENLSFGRRENSMKLPYGVGDLCSLKLLRFYEMPIAFAFSLIPGKEDHSKIKHIPEVCFCWCIDDLWKRFDVSLFGQAALIPSAFYFYFIFYWNCISLIIL